VAEKARLIARILDAQRTLHHLLAYDRSNPLFESQLTVPQLKLLLLLSLRGGASGQELGRLMGVSLATVTGMVDRLVAQHLVVRCEDPHDRRVRRIALTDAGQKQIDDIITAGIEYQQRMLQRLTVADLHTVDKAAALLVQAATAESRSRAGRPD
jgi:DNA-binding MarR family transcriptional regulator